MTRENLLEGALRAVVKVARPLAIAQERYDYWSQFGTHSTRMLSAEKKRDALLKELERAEVMADAALRGNVTLFEEAKSGR